MLSKSFILLFLAVLFIGFTPHKNINANKSTRWVICETSSLVVKGSTNLTRFSCAIKSYPKTDTIKVDRDKYTKKIVLSGSLSMAVAGFDCKNNMMTHELRKTLKQSQYPEININFLSLNGLPELEKVPVALSGLVEIEIAGIKKKFNVNYTIFLDENNEIQLIARRDINFSDFGLIPPKKMGKLIQAKDKLGVELNLKMKAI